jgi:uncharacterized cupredoxin-like copper-binding protein
MPSLRTPQSRTTLTAMPSRISRAPVFVTIAFFAIALTLVVIGAQRPSEAPPVVIIDTPGTSAAPRPVTVIMRDYRFDPSAFPLVAGETVRFSIFNAGLVPHEFSIGDAAHQAAWARADALATPPGPLATPPPASAPPGTHGLRVVLATGERTDVEYVVPADEDLLLLCNLPGHVERGMVGEVEVRRGTESPVPRM